jgi:hypothetical protein
MSSGRDIMVDRKNLGHNIVSERVKRKRNKLSKKAPFRSAFVHNLEMKVAQRIIL